MITKYELQLGDTESTTYVDNLMSMLPSSDGFEPIVSELCYCFGLFKIPWNLDNNTLRSHTFSACDWPIFAGKVIAYIRAKIRVAENMLTHGYKTRSMSRAIRLFVKALKTLPPHSSNKLFDFEKLSIYCRHVSAKTFVRQIDIAFKYDCDATDILSYNSHGPFPFYSNSGMVYKV